MKKAYLIIIGALLLLCAWLYFSDSGQILTKTDQSKYDSIIRLHVTKLAKLQRTVTITKHDIQVTKEKAKSDSITYKKTISRLQRELVVAKYKGVPAAVPDDSVQLAMDCLKKDPIRDSIDHANFARIASLEQEKIDLIKDYESIMDATQEQKNQLDSVVMVKDSQISELQKDNKKLKKGNKILKVLIPVALVGGMLLAK